jgi:predicted AlkP superfamily pyrophosphatase or phosphodiesterase
MIKYIFIKKLKTLTIFLFLFCALFQIIHSQDKSPYTLLISLDGVRYDFDKNDSLPNFNFIKENGVKANSLTPVFPTLSLPNLFSLLSGLYPINHGIIANTFKDPIKNDFYTTRIKGAREQNKWYIGETFWETAKRQGIITADINSIFPRLSDKNKIADFYIEFNSDSSYWQRIDEGLNFLTINYAERPNFLHFYFEDVDLKSHIFGVNSKEVNNSYHLFDSLIGYILTKLKTMNLYDSTNIIIVSEHGDMDIDSNNTINLDNILSGIRYELQNYGTFAMIDGRKTVLQEIFDSLKLHSVNYDVYFREDLPKHFNFSNHPYISPIILIAKPGWVMSDNSLENKTISLKAVNGYDNNVIDMHGIFYAMGPSFSKNYEVETINIIDIYPILCHIHRIIPRNNIDGSFERVKNILKDLNE